MMCRRRLLSLVLLASAAAGAARATTLARMSIAELIAAAPLIARVRCVGNATRWQEGEIWTITTLEVVEEWKGRAPARIALRLIGGQAGHLISRVAGMPRFAPGEEVVLFLEPKGGEEFSVTSWAQGTFRITRDRATGRETVTQDTAGYSVADPATHRYRNRGIRRMPLEEFRKQVLAAKTENRSGL